MEKLKMKTKPETKRPSVLLWLICRFTIVTLPLAVLLVTIASRMGFADNIVTLICCFVAATLITQWYEDLDEEVTDYIRKKYND